MFTQSHHNKKVPGLILVMGPLVRSLHVLFVRVGFLRVLWLPSTVQKGLWVCVWVGCDGLSSMSCEKLQCLHTMTAGIFCFISILIASLSNIFHSPHHFIYNFLKPKVMAYATWLTHWMSIILPGRFGDSRPGLTLELTRRKSSVHSGSWDDGSWSSMCGWRVNISICRRQLCGRGGGFMADLSRLGSEVVGRGGGSPIFTTAQHPGITTAVPTSLVCPPSGIAGLSAHSSALPLSRRLLILSRRRSNFWIGRWGAFGYSSFGITCLRGKIWMICHVSTFFFFFSLGFGSWGS